MLESLLQECATMLESLLQECATMLESLLQECATMLEPLLQECATMLEPLLQECATSSSDAALLLAGIGLLVLGTTLSTATARSGKPLDQLGERPHGTGLWSWLRNSYCQGIGVAGYDPILGSLHPTLRVCCHVSMIIFLWALLSLLWPVPVPATSASACVGKLPLSTWQAGATALAMYLLTCHRLDRLPGVSVSGGPRPHKIQRQPAWEEKSQTIDAAKLQNWRCAVAQDSHQATENKFGGQQQSLVGEADGRQIWTTSPKNGDEPVTVEASPQKQAKPNLLLQNLVKLKKRIGGGNDNKKKVDESLVQKMASGGRGQFASFDASKNPNSCDQIFRAQQIRNHLASGGTAPSMDPPKTVHEATRKAAHFYSMLQCEDGHWAGDYGGPHFLMPGMVTAWYVMGKPTEFLDDAQVELLKHYILVHQQSDGGWGTHIESPSTMFGSTLMYVALRLLGTDKEDPACVKGCNFLQDNGGALYTASWSKFYLCLLGCMDWRGHNSVPPEMWMLPNWFPFHPGRMWCHARMVYLPMGYLYGSRFVYEKAETDPVIQSLRQELYCEDYESISWMKTRHWVAPMDNYSPIPLIMKYLQNGLARYENWGILQPFKNYARSFGLKFSLEYMHAEDLQTNYIDIGPVNKVLNMLSAYHACGGELKDPKVVNHMMRVPDYLWIAEDGMKMQGYNGSQLWDTSFCAQAMYEANMLDEFPEVSRKVWGYLERTQILSTEVSQSSPAYQYESNEYREKFYRHSSEGGWPFSTSAHGWPISDCTSEGLKATLCLLKTKTIKDGLKDETLKPISEERLHKAINVLLTYQNEDGGWATYENNRGWGWYEQLNPSDAFGDIMIDYSYVECSMAVLVSIVDFREMFPEHRVEDIQHSIDKGKSFLKSVQREDGSWYGSWACCFCYGVWFGIEGLVRCGEPLDSQSIQKACDFLLRHQRPNGGWGEDFTSCYDKDYAEDGMERYGDDGSGVVSTAWALLALSCGQVKDVEAIKRGVRYLIKRQLPCGDWPQEGISGVFNRSVGITYTAYRNVFPIWALGRCSEVYGEAIDN